MLNQTRYTKEDLINCGINKKDLMVRTPFDYKHKGWSNPTITIFNSQKYCTYKTIRALLKLYHVIISIKDNKAVHICVFDNYREKGKLSIFDLNKNDFKRE
jgi:hypothetical protein